MSNLAVAKPLISCDALNRALSDDRLVVLDCRHSLTKPGAGEAAYRAGHIPRARHVDLDRDLARPARAGEGRHPLPDLDAFVVTLSRLGVSNDSRIVAYDDCGGAIAARLWWMMRCWLGHEEIAILDGGIDAWTVAGNALETEPPAHVHGAFRARQAQECELVTTTELIELLERGGVSLVDARAAARFQGLTEPIDPVAGHVPGAVNLPFSELLDADGSFSPPEDLRAQFRRVFDLDNAVNVVAMCGSGVTACHLLLGMEVAGLERGRLYVGSWSEWIRNPARAVAPERAR